MKKVALSHHPFVFLLAMIVFLVAPLHGSPRTEAGLTLSQPYGARAAALGEAMSSTANDIAAFGYNPASLTSLKSGHASFSFQQGLADDSFSHVLFGAPTKKGGFGLVVGHYDGGEIQIDGRDVTAQRDLMVGIGFAKNMGLISVGMTGKYLTSTLGETYSAKAYAADLGLSAQLSARTRASAALQNYGTKLKYQDEGDNLPRTVRAGFSYAVPFSKAPTSLMFDVPYSVNQKEYKPSLGIETLIGPLSLRAGYRVDHNNKDVSLGTGFMLGSMNLDYAFGLVNETNSMHRVSFSFRFAGEKHPALMTEKERPTAVEFDPGTTGEFGVK
jgi:hypothetical protein